MASLGISLTPIALQKFTVKEIAVRMITGPEIVFDRDSGGRDHTTARLPEMADGMAGA